MTLRPAIRCFSPVLLAFSLVGNLHAATVMGWIDCGTWLESRKSNTSKILEEHMVGMINGMSLGSGVEIWGRPGSKVSRDQFLFWMDNYCQKNPLSSTVAGAIDFADEVSWGEYRLTIKKKK